MLYDQFEPQVEANPTDYGYIHEDNVPNVEFLQDQVQRIAQALYVTGDMSIVKECLDEVCCELDMVVEPPAVNDIKPINLTDWYIEYQRKLGNIV